MRPASTQRLRFRRETLGRLENLIWCALCRKDHDREDFLYGSA